MKGIVLMDAVITVAVKNMDKEKSRGRSVAQGLPGGVSGYLYKFFLC